MINFRKVLSFLKHIFFIIFALFLSTNLAYGNNLVRLQLAGSQDNGLQKGRVQNTLARLASNKALQRGELIRTSPTSYLTVDTSLNTSLTLSRRGLLALTAGVVLSAPAVAATPPNFEIFSNSATVRINQQKDSLDDILKGLGFPEDRKNAIRKEFIDLVNSPEISNLFNRDIQGLLDKAKAGDSEMLIDFLKDLGSVLAKKKCIGMYKVPHPLIRLFGIEEDMELAIEHALRQAEQADNITEETKKQLIKEFNGCTAKSFLFYTLFKYKGIDEIRGVISPLHTSTLFYLGGTRYLIADFTLDVYFYKDIDVSIDYSNRDNGRTYEGYYFLQGNRIPRERESMLYADFEKGGLTLLRNRYKITDEQVVDLLFRYIHITDFRFVRNYNRSMLFLKLGRLDDALKEFEKADKAEPENDAVYQLGGMIYCESGNYEEALELFNRALSLNSRNSEAYINLGKVYSKMKHWDDALAQYHIAVGLGGIFTTGVYGGILYANIGINYFNSGDKRQAEEAFKKSISLDPQDGTPYLGLGFCYYTSDNHEERAKAEPYFIKAVDLNKNLLSKVPNDPPLRLRQKIAKQIKEGISTNLPKRFKGTRRSLLLIIPSAL